MSRTCLVGVMWILKKSFSTCVAPLFQGEILFRHDGMSVEKAGNVLVISVARDIACRVSHGFKFRVISVY